MKIKHIRLFEIKPKASTQLPKTNCKQIKPTTFVTKATHSQRSETGNSVINDSEIMQKYKTSLTIPRKKTLFFMTIHNWRIIGIDGTKKPPIPGVKDGCVSIYYLKRIINLIKQLNYPVHLKHHPTNAQDCW